jgi:hypothetical protein
VTFETNPKDLKDLLREAHEGKLQLPDFQRSYVWAEDDVRGLVASIARGFPVGALLTLESGGDVQFKPRVLEGVTATGQLPEQLLLDGQQRMTSLYGAFWSQEPMLTKLKKDHKSAVNRLFYTDIKRAVDGGENLEEAILSIRGDKIQRENFKVSLDLTMPEFEYEHHIFPLNRIFDPWDWLYAWEDFWRARGIDCKSMRAAFKTQVIEPIQSYKMPVIKLSKGSSREAICLIFEKVNVGGKKLDAFELVTAIFAGSDNGLDLRRDWYGERKSGTSGRLHRIVFGAAGKGHRQDVLADVKTTDFLQGISLAHTRERRIAAEANGERTLPSVTCKREALLLLTADKYRHSADSLEEGFRKAGTFLNERMILWQKDVPYPAQIVALATTHSILGKKAETISAKQRLAVWFWRVALAEDFGSATESKLGKDVPELIVWLEGGAQPERLERLGFSASRLDSLRSRLSAAYKAISALLMAHGCRDFVVGNAANIMSFHSNPMDIHHIFPKNWCKSRGIPETRFDSIINKTPLTAASNREIGGHAPSEYLRKIEVSQNLSPDALDVILRTHLIEPAYLRADDFDGFHIDRKARLTELISQAIGRPVTDLAETPEVSVELADDLDDLSDEAA